MGLKWGTRTNRPMPDWQVWMAWWNATRYVPAPIASLDEEER